MAENRIRALRKAKGWTLADLAAAVLPETTAQTIGRLETGTRTLSVDWVERIAAALEVAPSRLLRAEDRAAALVVARLGADGAEALATRREAVAPGEMGDATLVLAVEAASGAYLPGDQLWLRRIASAQAGEAVNRDVLVPRKGGRFAFGRLIDRHRIADNWRIGILPSGAGQKQIVIDDPEWIGVAHLLVRLI